MITDHTLITKKDIRRRYDLHASWKKALSDGKYKEADKLRLLYQGWDETLGSPDTWVPIFESTQHRYNRIKRNKGV